MLPTKVHIIWIIFLAVFFTSCVELLTLVWFICPPNWTWTTYIFGRGLPVKYKFQPLKKSEILRNGVPPQCNFTENAQAVLSKGIISNIFKLHSASYWWQWVNNNLSSESAAVIFISAHLLVRCTHTYQHNNVNVSLVPLQEAFINNWRIFYPVSSLNPEIW